MRLPLQALDVETFVHSVKHYGPTTEVRAYPDAFTLVALAEGQEVVRITLRESSALRIVRDRSGKSLTLNGLLGAARSIHGWGMDHTENESVFHADTLEQFIRVQDNDAKPFFIVNRIDGNYFKAFKVDPGTETVEWVELPADELARVYFFDRRQYEEVNHLTLRFSYEVRDGRLKVTYRLPEFQRYRSEAFADVVAHVAEHTGTRPLMLLSDTNRSDAYRRIGAAHRQYAGREKTAVTDELVAAFASEREIAPEIVQGVDRMIDAYNAATDPAVAAILALKIGDRWYERGRGPCLNRGGEHDPATGYDWYEWRVAVLRDAGGFSFTVEYHNSNPCNWRPSDFGMRTPDRSFEWFTSEDEIPAALRAFRALRDLEEDGYDNPAWRASQGITDEHLRTGTLSEVTKAELAKEAA